MDLITSAVIRNHESAFYGFPFARNILSTTISMSTVAVFAVLLGAFLKCNKLRKPYNVINYNYPKKLSTGVPSVTILAIVQCCFRFGTDFQKIFETLIERYGGIFKLKMIGLGNIVFIFNPEMLQKLYMSNEPGHLNKPKLYSKILGGPLQDGLVASRADVWKVHRGVINKAFTYKGLVRQLNIIEEHAKQFVLTLKEISLESSSSNKPLFSFNQQVRVLTYEIISHIIAGNEISLSKEDKTRCQNNQERLLEFTSYRIHHPLNYIDFIWNMNPVKWRMDKTLQEIDNYTYKIIEMTKELDATNIKDTRTGESLVELMIKAGLSNKEIFTEMGTILSAGHDTVSNTLSILIFLFACYKEYQDKCREEIDKMFDKMNGSKSTEISMELLNSLTFLDKFIKEALRLYPIIPLFGRDLETPIQLDESTFLPPKTIVMTSPWIIHGNPEIYPEPKKFDPERFSAEKGKTLGPGEYMPFSMGPRNCIGFKSATLELKVLVAYILHNFEVHSERSMNDLTQAIRKQIMPFPDFDIKVYPRY